MPFDQKILSFRTLSIFFAAIVLLGVILLTLWGDSPYVSIITYVAFLILNIFVILVLFYVARKSYKFNRRAYIGWFLIALSLLVTFLGNITWIIFSVYLNQYPTFSIADIFFLAYYPLLIMGILYLSVDQINKNRKYQILLDTGILIVSIALALWAILITPLLGIHNENNRGIAISLAYVFLEIFLLFILFYLIFNWLGNVKKNPFILLALSVTVLIITNIIYSYQAIYGSYVPGGLSDMGWLISYFLTALAGISYIEVENKTPSLSLDIDSNNQNLSLKFNWSSYLPALWLFFIFILLSWIYTHPNGTDLNILIGAGIIIMMMFIRQILALEESNEARKLLESNQKKLEIREQQIKSSLEEKEVLLKEIHHRVKNNMQIISSLLSLQSRYVKDEDDGEIFKECQNRVRSMAMIHENLYRSPNLAEINLQEYLQSLITGLFSSYGANPQLIITQMDLEKVSVDIDKFISCGLIINELISNSLKYAFPSNEGEITLSLRRLDGNELEMVVADDGVGFPENLDFRRTESLGLQLVNNLVKQLDGEIELENTRGTKFTIKFPG